MATGDVPDLIARYFDGDLRGGTDLSRATGGVVLPQTAVLYINGTARFADFPKYRTIMALTDALGFSYDDDVLRAFAISGKQMRMRDVEPAVVREVRMQGRLEVFDDHPRLVASIARQLGDLAKVLVDLRDET